MRTTCHLSSRPLLLRLLARTGVWLGLWRQPLAGAWPRAGVPQPDRCEFGTCRYCTVWRWWC